MLNVLLIFWFFHFFFLYYNCILGSFLGRERCDSLPSRNRTASECSQKSNQSNSGLMLPPRSYPSGNTIRPHSFYNSMKSGGGQVVCSPPKNMCLFDESDGSSVSIDETDSWPHSTDRNASAMRYHKYVFFFWLLCHSC